jgi:hypothetical protein
MHRQGVLQCSNSFPALANPVAYHSRAVPTSLHNVSQLHSLPARSLLVKDSVICLVFDQLTASVRTGTLTQYAPLTPLISPAARLYRIRAPSFGSLAPLNLYLLSKEAATWSRAAYQGEFRMVISVELAPRHLVSIVQRSKGDINLDSNS